MRVLVEVFHPSSTTTGGFNLFGLIDDALNNNHTDADADGAGANHGDDGGDDGDMAVRAAQKELDSYQRGEFVRVAFFELRCRVVSRRGPARNLANPHLKLPLP